MGRLHNSTKFRLTTYFRMYHAVASSRCHNAKWASLIIAEGVMEFIEDRIVSMLTVVISGVVWEVVRVLRKKYTVNYVIHYHPSIIRMQCRASSETPGSTTRTKRHSRRVQSMLPSIFAVIFVLLITLQLSHAQHQHLHHQQPLTMSKSLNGTFIKLWD